MIYKITKKIFKVILFILILIGIYVTIFVVDGLIEYKDVKRQINEFKERGKFIESIDNINYYEVIKEYEYEDDISPTFDYNTEEKFIGSSTDTILTTRNPIIGSIFEDIGALFAKYFYIGHATINNSYNGSTIVESLGRGDKKGVVESINDWILSDKNTPSIVALRVKELTDSKKEEIISNVNSKIGLEYNYILPIKTKNKYYCTDLVTRSFEENNIIINDDIGIVTGNDIIVSPNTYIFFYQERYIENNEVFYNIYFLKKGANSDE